MLNLKIYQSELKDLPSEVIEISEANKKLTIAYGGNGDLYFSTFCKEKEIDFIINRDDLILYNSFSKLYEKLEIDDYFRRYYKQLFPNKDEKEIDNFVSRYIGSLKQNLYDEETKKIVFVSCDLTDDNDVESRNYFEIIKSEKKYLLKMINKGNRSLFSVRINTNRSEYGNLVFLFTDLHHTICESDNYYQISIDDYNELKILTKRK